MIFRLRASNHTLSPMTKDLGKVSGLMRLCNAFCASDLAPCSCVRRSCAAGTESPGSVIDADGFVPVMSSCGVCFVCSCFQELCANSATGRRALQLFCHPMTNWQR